MNYDKSTVHFTVNVSHELKQQIVNILLISECDHHGKYLELPFCKGKSQVQTFSEVVEKLISKLFGWKGKLLSRAGRAILIKSVAQAQTSYAMQTYLLPI